MRLLTAADWPPEPPRGRENDVIVSLTREELRFLLRSVGEALEVRDAEFEARMGATRAEIESLMHAVIAVYDSSS